MELHSFPRPSRSAGDQKGSALVVCLVRMLDDLADLELLEANVQVNMSRSELQNFNVF